MVHLVALLIQMTLAQPAALQAARSGEDVATNVHVEFHLPPDWKAQQIVMDSIWKPLGLSGVNFYAFGAPTEGHGFAARSDPRSRLYQAWVGSYVVVGRVDQFFAGSPRENLGQAIRIAEYDQRAWLEGMGDPAPVAVFKPPYGTKHFSIDGADRTVYSFDMDSHSDISEGKTEIAKQLGMPPASVWSEHVSAFHPLKLHVLYSYWFDPQRNLTIVVYGVSSSFREKSGQVHDNGPVLRKLLPELMSSMRLRDLR